MRIKLPIFGAAATFFLMVASPLVAHHGTAAYDLQKSMTLEGSVTSLEWTNPHCLLHFDAKSESGEVQHWSIEMYNTLWMTRAGWTRSAVHAGDPITITFHAAKNGTTNGYVRDGDGKVNIAGKDYGFHEAGDERPSRDRSLEQQ
jgi:hypothetical protein